MDVDWHPLCRVRRSAVDDIDNISEIMWAADTQLRPVLQQIDDLLQQEMQVEQDTLAFEACMSQEQFDDLLDQLEQTRQDTLALRTQRIREFNNLVRQLQVCSHELRCFVVAIDQGTAYRKQWHFSLVPALPEWLLLQQQ